MPVGWIAEAVWVVQNGDSHSLSVDQAGVIHPRRAFTPGCIVGDAFGVHDLSALFGLRIQQARHPQAEHAFFGIAKNNGGVVRCGQDKIGVHNSLVAQIIDHNRAAFVEDQFALVVKPLFIATNRAGQWALRSLSADDLDLPKMLLVAIDRVRGPEVEVVDLPKSHPHGSLVRVVTLLAGHVLHRIITGHLDSGRPVNRVDHRLIARLCQGRKERLTAHIHLHGVAIILDGHSLSLKGDWLQAKRLAGQFEVGWNNHHRLVSPGCSQSNLHNHLLARI